MNGLSALYEIEILAILTILTLIVIIALGIVIYRFYVNKKVNDKIYSYTVELQKQNEIRLNNTLKTQEKILDYIAKDLELKRKMLKEIKEIKEN
ncbi:MAG TPA: hypothetical protein GXX15_01275 [Clostridia bacterium]|nr:hypothetical protein [Clostridia bacterium]